jgi:hypothetical protein
VRLFGHGQHVTDIAFFQPVAQGRVLPLRLIGLDPRERHARIDRAGDHLPGQLRLGREPDLFADAGLAAAVPVIGP